MAAYVDDVALALQQMWDRCVCVPESCRDMVVALPDYMAVCGTGKSQRGGGQIFQARPPPD